MRKIISLLMIALSVFFAMPEVFALNPPNNPPSPTKPNSGNSSGEDQTTDGDDDTAAGDDGANSSSGNGSSCSCCDPNKDPNCKKDPPSPPGGGGNDPNCFELTIPFGRMLNEPTLSNGKFFLNRQTPTPTLFSPQGLYFSHNLFTGIISVTTENLAEGVAREVVVFDSSLNRITYRFPTGSSMGTPIGDRTSYVTKLQMLDANCNPVTANPVYYELISGRAATLRFSADTTMAVAVKTMNGRVLDLASRGIGLDIVLEENILRQVKSNADGLADLIVIDEYKYEVRLYRPENVGEKGTDGIYQVAGSPYTVWTIENPLKSDTNYDHVRVTQTVNGVSYVDDWEYSTSLRDWKVTSGGGIRTASKETYFSSDEVYVEVRENVSNSSGALTEMNSFKNKKFSWGYATLEKYEGDPTMGLKTEFTYYDASTDGRKLSLRKTMKNYTGDWATYQYDDMGRTTLMIESYLDSAYGSAESGAASEATSYVPVDPADVLVENDQRPRTVERRINGIPVSKTYYAYIASASGDTRIEEEAATPAAGYGAAGNMRTTTVSYPSSAEPALSGRTKSITKPDGTKATYNYEYGTYTANADPAACSFTTGTGYAMRRTITNGTTAFPDGIAGKTLREVVVTDEFGNDVLEEKYVYTGSGYERIVWTVKNFDSEHHVTASYISNNTSTAASWNCCNKASETTAEGIEYVYTYDLLKRMATKTKKGHSGTSDIVTSYAYDASGRVLSETVSADGLSLSTSKTYDLLGRVLSETDSSGLTTTYAYSSNGKTTTKTLPGGFTEITENYADGQIKSVTGTAVVAKYYEYGVNTDGTRWTKIYTGASGSPRWAKTTADMLNRVIKEEQPGYNGSTIVTQYFYNNKSQLIKVSKTGSADTLYAYDEVGNQIRSCFDVNANGTIDLASMDRVSDQETTIVNENNAWWLESGSKVYALDNDATVTTTGTTKSQLTGLALGTVSKQISVDIYGNITTSTTTLNATNKTITRTTDVPDSTADAVEISVNGLRQSSQSTSNLITTYVYDALDRKTGVTDPRTGTSVTHYNALGRVDYVENAAGNRTSYTYDATTGRLTTVTNPLSVATTYTYNTRGQTLTVRGDAEYPVDFVYDSYGQITQLKTYRLDMNTPDITTWNYEAATGLLLSKIYADNKGGSYTYTTSGKLATRTWARGITTTYTYNALDELTRVDYSDTTPDVSSTYDRVGRTKTVTDAVGSRSFAYNLNLQLESEVISGLYNKVITRDYEATGMIGRNKGFHIGTEYDVDYGYDDSGRLSTLTNGSDAYTYNYLANSNLLASINYPNNISVTNSYEANRNLITSIENKYNSTTISKYDYVNDAIARRSSMVKSGTAFSQTDTIIYGYNDRSEATSAVATNDSTYNFGFSFDNIGNRITGTESGILRNYTSNLLNQYTQIDNPSQLPTYDDDGDMLTNDNWHYMWNGENRLAVAESSTQKLEFTYDYMGRRVEKKVYSGSTGNWTLVKNLRFVYDGYKLVEELNGANSNAILRKYVWNSEELLSVYDTENTATYYYFTDANKNIGQLIDNSGNIVAAYEYSPFGKITSKTGAYSDVNPFNFSSEYFDKEIELIYYNYRYYSPILGRWLTRDPIEEDGGLNLYGMIKNDAINLIDLLGFKECCDSNNKKVDEVTDDAGRKCCPSEIKTIELRNARATSGSDVGHSFVHTPNNTKGFYPSDSWHFFYDKGEFHDDSNHAYDPELTYSYSACPETVDAVDKAMMNDINLDSDLYDLTNVVGNNCSGMACRWIDAGGLTAPYSPYSPGLRPAGQGQQKGYGPSRGPK